jgi:hypothetical protein
MKHIELIERIQAVLEGDATPDQARELDRQLAVDASARAEFEQWQRLFVALGRVPQASPPEGLVAAVTSAADAHLKISRGRDQPLDRHAVIGSGVGSKTGSFFGFPGFLSRPRMRPSTTQESAHMNINRKVLAGGALAAVALGVALVMGGLPPKSENVVGTIAPAERYRAPQSGAEAVQLGQPTTAQTSTAAAGISTAATADKADAASLKAEKADAAGLKAAKADAAGLRAEKADAAGLRAEKADAAGLRAEKADAAGLRAEKADAAGLRAEKADAAGLKADKANSN